MSRTVRKKTPFFVFIPLLLAIGLLSLPKAMNRQIQERAGNALASLLSSFHGKETSETARHALHEGAHIASLRKWFQHQEDESKKIAEMQTCDYPFLTGKVILRSVNSWNSFFWIDIGSNDNTDPLCPILCKNSPVLNGDSVVGVIDYVGQSASLVRLITDSTLTPAVRVARGGIEQARMLGLIEELQSNLPLFSSEPDVQAKFHAQLSYLQSKLSPDAATLYLAKGELQGHGEPLFRSPGKCLRGVGFNYDWADSHGPSCELQSKNGQCPLIQTQDLLVTSGLDGVFPEGLPIARVHSISPLKEGAIAYEIMAEPTARDILDLSYVIVIAPQREIAPVNTLHEGPESSL